MRVLAVLGTVIVIGCYCATVAAAPPERADPALAPWFKSLRQPQTNEPCCDMSDCRTVRYRIAGDHFQAFIGSQFPRWQNAPHAWVDVPNANVLRRRDNPVGEGIACWFRGQVICFVEGDST
ncbi:MAG: hypothetical protein EXR07_01280 [Acetobacteraceae bacterium]|nr:hypothetical protein [Acetobacteraceae bacterium]